MSEPHPCRAAVVWFLFLLFGFSSASNCQLYPQSECQKHNTFVPGHNYIGEGFDITTLERKWAHVVDSSQWQRPDGTCILCHNPLMGGQLQKVPLVGANWKADSTCHWRASRSVEGLEDDVDVANAVAMEVMNAWEAGLGWLGDTKGSRAPKKKVAYAGAQSPMAIYAYRISKKDKFSFVMQEISCAYYSLWLQNSSLLTPHFSQAVAKLPTKNITEEYQHFINLYGTHYINLVQLGGRLRDLLALQTCKMALNGVSASDIKDYLTSSDSSEHDLPLGLDFFIPGRQPRRDAIKRPSFSDSYGERTEMVGGEKQMEMLFLKTRKARDLSAWLGSTKTKPGLVSYSLQPLHTLLNQEDPRRGFLKQAIVSHIHQRALLKDCKQNCPPWSSQSSAEHCTCMCQDSPATNHLCCAQKQGTAHLKFHIDRAYGLWGDVWSATDAYVTVMFKGLKGRTRVILGDDNPVWDQVLDFGPVTLTGDNTYTVELWDNENSNDELLHRCEGTLVAGSDSQYYKCSPPYGYFKFSYSLKCGQTLGGPSCQNYIPLRLPTSYFNNTGPSISASHWFRGF